jgi:hypothetical protein
MTTQYSNRNFARAATLVAQIMLLSTFVCSARTPQYSQTLMLGGQWKHEKLARFKARFPHSICGTPDGLKPVNRYTLDDPDDSEWLTCCVDDPKEVSAFSAIKVISRNHYSPVVVVFYRARLENVHFTVDASSIETVLPEFEKVYGPLHQVKAISTKTGPVRFASWQYGDVTLELSEELRIHSTFDRPPASSDNTPDAKIVIIDLF